MYGLPGVRSIHNKNLLPNERAASAVSRYSAVVFTNPVEQISKKSKKKTESDDDDYEDDFEDEFEAYETSDEEKKDPKS